MLCVFEVEASAPTQINTDDGASTYIAPCVLDGLALGIGLVVGEGEAV